MFGMPCRPLFFLLIVLLSLLALFALKPSTAGTMVMPNLALANHGIAIERLTESGQNDKSETGKKTEIAHKPSFNLNCQLHLLFVGIVFGRFWAPSGKSGQMLQSLAIFLSSLAVVHSFGFSTPFFGIDLPDEFAVELYCNIKLPDVIDFLNDLSAKLLEDLGVYQYIKNGLREEDKNTTLSGLLCRGKKGCNWGTCIKDTGSSRGFCCEAGFAFTCCKKVRLFV
ncbi:hypothetical protein niasHT_012058 [Heterodera trifolii]|uniref:Cocaine- and amphetamine-regulated transcript protein n=1 Tax=Heterodera trifolii TaxID=157864 RepID=A0ABD2LCE8_9BILA